MSTEYIRVVRGDESGNRDILKWTRASTIVSAVLTIPIAIGGIWAAMSAQQSVRLTRENFIVDQRPYVWLTNDLGAPQLLRAPNGNLQVTWAWHFTNYGKTPANHTRDEDFISINGEKFEPSFGSSNQQPKSGIPIPPNLVPFREVVSKPITDEAWTRALTTDYGISIAGIIYYEDAAGKKYQSMFCIGRLATGAIAYREPLDGCGNKIE